MMSFLLWRHRFKVEQKSVFSFREDEFVVGFLVCRGSVRGRSDDSIVVGDTMEYLSFRHVDQSVAFMPSVRSEKM
jgi:hypothetical protein